MSWASLWYKKRFFVNAVDSINVNVKSSRVSVNAKSDIIGVNSKKSVIGVRVIDDKINVTSKSTEIGV